MLFVAHIPIRMTTNGSPKSFIAFCTGYYVYKPCSLIPRPYSQLNFQCCIAENVENIIREGGMGTNTITQLSYLINTEL